MDDIDAAVAYKRRHPRESTRAVAKRFNVNGTTLGNRLQGTHSSRLDGARGALTVVEQRVLVDHINTLADRGTFLTPPQVKSLAEEICKRSLGGSWTGRFLKRFKNELSTRTIEQNGEEEANTARYIIPGPPPREHPSVTEMLQPGDLLNSERPIKVYKEAELSYDDYLNSHLVANEPFILINDEPPPAIIGEPFNLLHDPRTRALLLKAPLGQEKPNESLRSPLIDYLQWFSDMTVPVADLKTYDDGGIVVTERKLEDVLRTWRYKSQKGEKWYVKDWHLQAEREKEGSSVQELYNVPEIFWDDWLNPPFDKSQERVDGFMKRYKEMGILQEGGSFLKKDIRHLPRVDDFRFCYVGPPYTFTPIHRDVYGSYSWSFNACGRKLWYLFPPGSYKTSDAPHVWEWPDEGKSVMRVLQKAGETIFVPSGWYHEVVNLDYVISFNHNFFSSVSLPKMYDVMIDSIKQVTLSILDVRDMIQERLGMDGPWEVEWLEEVQELLKKDAGWNWKGFWEIVLHNLNEPPAPERLSPPPELRDRAVREVVDRFKKEREYELLPELKGLVDQVEAKLGRVHGHNTRVKRPRKS